MVAGSMRGRSVGEGRMEAAIMEAGSARVVRAGGEVREKGGVERGNGKIGMKRTGGKHEKEEGVCGWK